MSPQTTPRITPFFHQATSSWSYVAEAGPGASQCVVIDPVLDCDGARARTGTTLADAIIAHIRDRGLQPEWILETHAHADRMSAAPYIRDAVGGRIGIGAGIKGVQETWNGILNLSGDARFTVGAFDAAFDDGAEITAGPLSLRVMHTPGHTPADVTYVAGDAAFVGDTLFSPDYGTARVDFPDGDARELYRSIQRIYALGDDTRLFLCHDYLTDTRTTHRCEVTVGEQKRDNIHARADIGEDTFVQLREARDKTLDFPKLLLLAVPFNLAGGRAPEAEANGRSYLKVPLNRF